MNNNLHIVCFDAPVPPDYGGAIDLYYKIIALAHAGAAITLHYFQYREGRGHTGLAPYCKQVFVYERKKPVQCLHSPLPYIVSSRFNRQLAERLNKDNDPVLLEGIHCTGILPLIKKENRFVCVRLHNNEAAYYRRLAQTETSPFRNLYFIIESNRLEKFQQSLPKKIFYAALSQADVAVFKNTYGLEQTEFLPSFVPWNQLATKEGLGTYCLYHGNLSVPENSAVVLWLLKNVFAESSIPFIVAGKNAPARLQHAMARYSHVQWVNNPTDEEMEKLVQHAQVHVLPSLNETGIKIKLLHALFHGRHCLTNKAGVAGSGLEALVHTAEDWEAMKAHITRLMQQPFAEKEKQQREETLLPLYDNAANARALIAWISKHCR